MPRVRRLRPEEVDPAADVAHAAFGDDPILRWVLPDDDRWASVGWDFLANLLRVRLIGGEAWVTDDISAVAAWDPPGGMYATEPGLWEEFNARLTPDEHERLEAFDHLVDAAQPPQPRWYLGVLTVHPDRQGRGLGRAVTEPIRAAADRQRLPTTLETGNPVNLAIYARLGFEVLTSFVLPGDGPHVWLLQRQPSRTASEQMSW